MLKSVIILASLMILHYEILVESCDASKFVKFDHKELKSHVVETIQRIFVELCWGECIWLPWCLSINVRNVSEIEYECDLSNVNRTSAPDDWNPGDKICKMYNCNKKDRPQPTTQPETTAAQPITQPQTTAPQPTTQKESRTPLPTTQPDTTTPQATTTQTVSSGCQIDFPRQSTEDYVLIYPALALEVTSFTLSFWIKPSKLYKDALQVFSYYDLTKFNALSLRIRENGIAEIQINGYGKSLHSDLAMDDTWQNVIIIWKNSDGQCALFKNGAKIEQRTGLAEGSKVKTGGTMYLGQRHADEGFDSSKVLGGSIADLEIWSTAVADAAVPVIYNFGCQSAAKYKPGEILSWEKIMQATFAGQAKKTYYMQKALKSTDGTAA